MNEAQTLIDNLREVIAAWPKAQHDQHCEDAPYNRPCCCQADKLNAARKEARFIAGLEAAP